jgi:hypothetical protein
MGLHPANPLPLQRKLAAPPAASLWIYAAGVIDPVSSLPFSERPLIRTCPTVAVSE